MTTELGLMTEPERGCSPDTGIANDGLGCFVGSFELSCADWDIFWGSVVGGFVPEGPFIEGPSAEGSSAEGLFLAGLFTEDSFAGDPSTGELICGGSFAGGSLAGELICGESFAGELFCGGSFARGSLIGELFMGGSFAGGSFAGGSLTGGSLAGGSCDGGSCCSGSLTDPVAIAGRLGGAVLDTAGGSGVEAGAAVSEWRMALVVLGTIAAAGFNVRGGSNIGLHLGAIQVAQAGSASWSPVVG